MILLSKAHLLNPSSPTDQSSNGDDQKEYDHVIRSIPQHIPRPSVFVADLIRLFSEHRKPELGDEVVYVPGAFDFFHIGHLSFLEKVARPGR